MKIVEQRDIAPILHVIGRRLLTVMAFILVGLIEYDTYQIN